MTSRHTARAHYEVILALLEERAYRTEELAAALEISPVYTRDLLTYLTATHQVQRLAGWKWALAVPDLAAVRIPRPIRLKPAVVVVAEEEPAAAPDARCARCLTRFISADGVRGFCSGRCAEDADRYEIVYSGKHMPSPADSPDGLGSTLSGHSFKLQNQRR